MIKEHANPHKAISLGNSLMKESIQIPVDDIKELNKGREGNWLNHKISVTMYNFVELIKNMDNKKPIL